MNGKSKEVATFADAVCDIPDGATIAFGGFSGVGMPFNLLKALIAQGAKNLTCIVNSTGGGPGVRERLPDVGMLVENGQVKKVICAFSLCGRKRDRSFSGATGCVPTAVGLAPAGTD